MPDSDNDAAAGTPLTADVDFRDALNTAPPVAQDDAFALAEDPDANLSEIGMITNGNLLADNGGNGPDSDVNGDALSITQINGIDITNNQQITLDSGALLTIRTDGTFDYNPNGAFDFLDTGEDGTETFTYTLSDGTAADTDTATVTITISGDNDAPIIDLNGSDNEGEDFSDTFVEDEAGRPLANLLSIDAVIQDDEDNIASVAIIPVLPNPNDGESEFLRINNEGINLSVRLSDGQILIDGEIATPGQTLTFGETEFIIEYRRNDAFIVDDSAADVAISGEVTPPPNSAVGNIIEIRNANGARIDSDDLQGLLRLFAYQNTDQNNTEGVREFIFQVTEPLGTTVATSSITVERVNDAPVPTVLDENDSDFNGTVVDTSMGETPAPILIITPESAALSDALTCLLYTSPSPRDRTRSRMPSSA